MDRRSVGNTVMLKEELQENQKSVGNICIPGIIKADTRYWRVVGLGTGVKDKNGKTTPFKVDIGDLIFIDLENNTPTTVTLDSEKLVIINQNAILAKVDN